MGKIMASIAKILMILGKALITNFLRKNIWIIGRWEKGDISRRGTRFFALIFYGKNSRSAARNVALFPPPYGPNNFMSSRYNFLNGLRDFEPRTAAAASSSSSSSPTSKNAQEPILLGFTWGNDDDQSHLYNNYNFINTLVIIEADKNKLKKLNQTIDNHFNQIASKSHETKK